MICENCGKEIGMKLVCGNCFNVVDFDKHEEYVDKCLSDRGINFEKQKLKKNQVTCSKCGAAVNIGNSTCGKCGHIISMKLATEHVTLHLQCMKEELKYNEVDSSYVWLVTMCAFVPFLGLILKLLVKKKNPLLADLCFKTWTEGYIGHCFEIVIIILVVLSFI